MPYSFAMSQMIRIAAQSGCLSVRSRRELCSYHQETMDLTDARQLAVELMRQHGLSGWMFCFDHARRRFGSCKPGRKQITLSRHLTFLNSPEQVRDTLLHEIAHALTPGDGHGSRWKAKCREIGANPKRCYDDTEVVSPPRRLGAYVVSCTTCGWSVSRHRASARKLICRKCRNPVKVQARILQR